MWTRHPALLGTWLVLLAMFALGWVFELELFLFLPFFAGMLVAPLTYRFVTPGVLARRGLYYVLVGSLLLAAATTLVAAGSTLLIQPGSPLGVVGFTVLGVTNVLIVIVTWRALVRPTPKRAALAGMLAVVSELVAMIVDVVTNHWVHYDQREVWSGIALVGALIAVGAGALACIASLSAFRDPDEQDIPAARIVDEGARSS